MRTSACSLRTPVRKSKSPPTSWFEAWWLWLRLYFYISRESCALRPRVTESKLLRLARAEHAMLPFPTAVSVRAVSTPARLDKASWPSGLHSPTCYQATSQAHPHLPWEWTAMVCTLPPKACCALILLNNLQHFMNEGETGTHHCKVVHLHDPRHQFWLKEQVQNNW